MRRGCTSGPGAGPVAAAQVGNSGREAPDRHSDQARRGFVPSSGAVYGMRLRVVIACALIAASVATECPTDMSVIAKKVSPLTT